MEQASLVLDARQAALDPLTQPLELKRAFTTLPKLKSRAYE